MWRARGRLGSVVFGGAGDAFDEGADGVVVVAAGEGEADEFEAALGVVAEGTPFGS